MNETQKEKIETQDGYFSAEYIKRSPMAYAGSVYPITEWWSCSSDASGWAYDSKTDAGTHEELNDDCRKMFEFSFCWRGVWEGRIYFKDEEYWSEELPTMAVVWDKIQVLLKDAIRNEHSEREFED